MTIATRLGRLEGALGVRPPQLLAAVTCDGVAVTLLYDDGTVTNDVAVPVADLPPAGWKQYVEWPGQEWVSLCQGLDGGPCATRAGVDPDVILGRRLLPPNHVPSPPGAYRPPVEEL
jgi:hypothetical protein